MTGLLVNAMVVAFSGSKVVLTIDKVDVLPGLMGRDCVLWPVVGGTVVFSDTDSEVGAKVLAVVVGATVDACVFWGGGVVSLGVIRSGDVVTGGTKIRIRIMEVFIAMQVSLYKEFV